MTYRTDRNNNPTAMTTDITKMALQEGTEYVQGEPFASMGVQLHTAKLIGDPIALTIKVIDKIGFFTKNGQQRWAYIGLPSFIWEDLTTDEKKQVIGWMYGKEGGTELRGLFT